MIKKYLLPAGIAILAMTIPASLAFAEEAPDQAQEETTDDIFNALFGDEGILKDVIPEDTDIEAMLDTAKEQLSEANDEISEVVGSAIDSIKEEVSNVDPESVKEYIGDLIGYFTGSDDLDFDALEQELEIFDKLKKAEEDYILEHNADLLEQGDVQIISKGNMYSDKYDVDPIRVLAYMGQFNYKADDENNLRFLSSAEDVVLFYHENNEAYTVADTVFAEDGEEYMPSINTMCDVVGYSPDECLDDIELSKVMVIYDLRQYLIDNPEVNGIEYEGQIRSADDLDELWGERLAELYPEETEEPAAEETAAE